jgi:hypothetical protein
MTLPNTGSKGSSFFMAHLDKPDLVLMRPQRLKEPINAIAGQSKHRIDPPDDKALNDQVSNCFGHVFFLIAQSMSCVQRSRSMRERFGKYSPHRSQREGASGRQGEEKYMLCYWVLCQAAIFSISAHPCLQERGINHASILLRHRILSDSCRLGL